jgi:MFS family permease
MTLPMPGRDASRSPRRGPLRSRNFRLLVACNAVSMAGSAVALVAVPFAVLSIGGSASDVGYVSTAELVPLIAVLLVGGVIADRLPRHQVLVAANAVQALAQGTAATLILTGQARVWLLAALAAGGGAGAGLGYPAAQGLLPQTVPADQRAQANALDRTVRSAASIGGAALGGLLIGLAGPGWGLAIDAASFGAAAALRTGMRFASLPPAPAAGLLHDLRDGWREFTSRRWLWSIVAQFAILVAVSAGTTGVLGPLIADACLGGARSWGLILGAYAGGAVGGGLVMTRLRPRRILVAAVAALPPFAILLFALAVPLAAPLDAVAALLAGGSVEVFSVSWATALQQEIPPDRLSRVSSYDALGSYALAPAGTAVAGPLAAAFGARAVLAAGGGLVVLLPLLVLGVPEVRRLRRITDHEAVNLDAVSRDGRGWAARLPAELAAQRALLDGLLDLCEADGNISWLVIGCSVARGAGDRLSDLDVGMGVRPEAFEATAAAVRGAVDRLGDLVDSFHHQLPGVTVTHDRVFAQFADGSQVDLVVFPASVPGGSVPNVVVLYDPDGQLVVPPATTAPATTGPATTVPAERRPAGGPEQVREWAFLGWCALADLSKYLRRRSAWEAYDRLQEARTQLWRLQAAAHDVPDPQYGLTSILDFSPGAIPAGIEDTVAGLEPARLLAAAQRLAALLDEAGRRLEADQRAALPDAMARYVTAGLASLAAVES